MTAHEKKLESLFEEAKQRDPGVDRDEFISAVEGRDNALGLELRDLLKADVRSESVFGGLSALGESEPDGLAGTMDSHDGVSLKNSSGRLGVGSQIGSYKLLEPIGEGGMGLVYLAQQSEPVRRKVALKIIKPGMDSKQVIARFEAERQALAMMDHPNIAKVLDAGTTETGLPYFVMELVRGIPMMDYYDQAKMPTRRRLELFRDACSAIQHAHNKGVIHRDIKPSNVLLTEQDGEPLVKVIDFGIAKALTDNLTDKTMFTGMFQMMGTPLYMSPEQASLSDVDVDTRSDVYSLGVMLYELLSGTLPIDRDAAQELSFDELRKRICETEPPRPSKRLSTLNDDARETLVERRGGSKQKVHRLIANELDWIVMKAIEKNRSRRYQSSRELSEDIGRYLTGDAVEACPPSMAYRLKKFYRKNQTLTVLATTIVVAAVSIAAVSVWQTRKASLAEQKATDESQNLKGVVNFLVNDLLGSATPSRSEGNEFSVLEALANARATISDAYPDDTQVGATIRHSMAVTYSRLGEYDQAANLAREAYESRSELLGDSNDATLDSLSTLANALAYSGDSECIELYDRLIDKRNLLTGPDSQDTLMARMNRALATLGRHGNDDAVLELRDVVYKAEELFGPRDTFTLTAKSNLVEGLYRQSEFAEASAIGGDIFQQIGALDGESVPLALLDGLRVVAKLQTKVARFDEAESTLRAILQTQRKFLGPKHPQLLRSIRELAECLYQQYDRSKSEELTELYQEWESVGTELYGKNSETVWRAKFRLIDQQWRAAGTSHEVKKDALEQLDVILNEPAMNLPLDSGVRFEVLQAKAFILNDLRRFQKSAEIHRQIVTECQQRYPAGHERIHHARYDLARVLVNMGLGAEAEEALRDVLGKQEALLGEDHSMVLATCRELGRAIYIQKRYGDAAEIYKRAAEIRARSPKHTEKPIDPSVYHKIANCYLVEGNFSEAAEYLRGVVENLAPTKSIVSSQSLNNLLAALQKLGRENEIVDLVPRFFPLSQLDAIRKEALAYPPPNGPKHRRYLGVALSQCAWRLALQEAPKGKERSQAVAYGRLSVEFSPVASSYSNFGAALCQNGQFEESVKALNKADELIEGGDREHRMFLAIALWQTDKRKEALARFAEGIAWQDQQKEVSDDLRRSRQIAEELLQSARVNETSVP
ncbi:MAG: hypothetical protein Aurels2KO_56550 [Aureliella sp.]